MMFTRWLKNLAPVLLALVLLVSACSAAPNKYDQAQKDTSGWKAPAAVDKKAEQGSTFNQFFPSSQDGYEVVPTQEKKGFAEYKLNKGGQTVAMLSINDTTSLPAAAAKYTNTTETIAGYPAVNQGTTATGILISDRYQVKVLSRSPEFTQADRVTWLQKFDLQGLAQLKGALAPAAKAASASKVLPAPKAPALSGGGSQDFQSSGLIPQPAS